MAAAAATGLAATPAMAEGQRFGINAPLRLEDLRFGEIAPGISVSVLWGDPWAGPSAIMLRLAPGTNGPMRASASDIQAVVVEGRLRHWVDGTDPADADVLGPGDYWFQPAGEAHGDANPGDEPVTVFFYVAGPFDPLAANE